MERRENLACIHKNQIPIDLTDFIGKVNSEKLCNTLRIYCNSGDIFSRTSSLILIERFYRLRALNDVTFLSIAGTVFLTAGICGILSPYFKNNQSKLGRKLMVKSSRIFRFLAVLGIASLVALPAFWFWSSHSAEVMRFFMDTPLVGFLLSFVFLFGGISLLTVGIC